jgi:hypothetical protein
MTTTQSSRQLAAENFTVEIHISELNQLFNSLDPSPFYAKELNRNAEAYIVRAAQELPSSSPTALVVHLATVSARAPSDESMLNQALSAHFARQLQRFRRELRQLINRGWISLGIGLAFLRTCLIGGEIVSQAIGRSHIARVLQESLVIGGWVARWRPLEIFLYNWWPILGQCRIYDRFSRIPVRIVYDGKSSFQQPHLVNEHQVSRRAAAARRIGHSAAAKVLIGQRGVVFPPSAEGRRCGRPRDRT